MTAKEFCRIVNLIAYKPHWSIIPGYKDYGIVTVDIAATVQCAKARDHATIRIHGQYSYDPSHFHDEKSVLEAIRAQLISAETHEADEWFYYKGYPFDPHVVRSS